MEKVKTIREITVCGYTATVPITFERFGIETNTYYIPTSQTTKAIKAILKAAGFTVTRVKTEDFSMGNSSNVWYKSELSEEDRTHNISSRLAYTPHDFRHEPRIKLIQAIARKFQQGSYDGMTDSYNYNDDRLTVLDPDGNPKDLTSKWVFIGADN